MLDRSEISSVPLRGATDDDVVTWSLRGDGSSCVQAAYHWNDTSLLAATTHNSIQYFYMFRHVAAQSVRERRASSYCPSKAHIHQPASLSHCIGLHKQKIHRAQACEA